MTTDASARHPANADAPTAVLFAGRLRLMCAASGHSAHEPHATRGRARTGSVAPTNASTPTVVTPAPSRMLAGFMLGMPANALSPML